MDFLDALYGLTEGNPFFIEEILKALVAAGEIFYHDGIWDRRPLAEIRIPRSIHDALQRSLTRVSEHARHILALAAVVGRGFDFALLLALSDLAEAELIGALKELIAERLVIEESGERFAFRHALVREAIYTDLLVRERAALHSTIATTIERQGDQAVDERLADLAYHFSEAGLWRQARVYARRAGEHALRMDAPRTAIEQLTRALDAARHEGIPSEPELLLLRGQAYETIGDFEHALADLTETLRLAAEQRDERSEWRAHLALGLLWTSRDYQRAEEPLRRALALARDLDDPKALAHSLNRLDNWYLNVEAPLEAVNYHHQALALFRSLNDRRGLAETLDLLAMATIMAGNTVRSFGYFKEAADAFRELNDRQGQVTPLVMQCVVRDAYLMYDACGASIPVEIAFVTRQGEEAIKLAQLTAWRAGESYAYYEFSMCYGARGAYGEALDLANRALAIAEEIQHRQWIVGSHVALGRFYFDILAFPLAMLHLRMALELAHALRSSNWVQMASAMLASLYVQQGEYDAAATLLAADFDLSHPPQSMNQRMGWGVRGEIALAQGQPAVAFEHVNTLLATRPEGTADEDVILRLWLLHGQAHAALKQWDPAERSFREAQAAAETLGLQPLLWRIHRALAQIYQQQGRREQTDAERVAARTIIETLATRLPNAQLRETFLRQAQALVPLPRSPSPRKATKDTFGGLTAREREIMLQLAQGKPNREIAAALVVSERTVEYHVGNILGKLGLSSRSQAAVWAVEHGLVAQSPASS